MKSGLHLLDHSFPVAPSQPGAELRAVSVPEAM